MNAEVRIDISNSGDGNSPSVQRREGSATPSGLGWSDLHIELPSPQREQTLVVTFGSPLDFDCPLCEKPKGTPCGVRTVGKKETEPHFHLDRVKLMRVSIP